MAATESQTTTSPAHERNGETSAVPMEMSAISASQQPGLALSQDPEANINPHNSGQTVQNPLGKDDQTQHVSTTIPTSDSLNVWSPDALNSVNASSAAPPPLIREASRPAIGPALDQPNVPVKEAESDGPALNITLLLTTGARHPFKLDRKYLKKRNIEVEGDDPVNISLYKLKELILRDWRSDWESKPASPDSIRLILMGKMLMDKSKLSELGFKTGAAPAIVHMSIKPQDLLDEEEANKTVRDRENNVRTPRCRCTIM